MDMTREILRAENRVHRLHYRCIFGDAADCGIHPGQMPMLDYIGENPDCTQSELAHSLGIAPATVAVSLRRMEAAGLVERGADANDMRVARAKLTPQGTTKVDGALKVQRRLSEVSFRGFDDAEKRQYLDFQRRIAGNLQEYLNEGDNK